MNARVAVFGVVFATVWAGKEHRRAADVATNPFPATGRERRCIHELDGWRVDSHPPLDHQNHKGDLVSSTSEKDIGNIQGKLTDCFAFVGGIRWSDYLSSQMTVLSKGAISRYCRYIQAPQTKTYHPEKSTFNMKTRIPQRHKTSMYHTRRKLQNRASGWNRY